MTRCFIASTSNPSLIAARRRSIVAGHSNNTAVVPRSVATIVARASNKDSGEDSSSSPQPSMFRRLALALGVASATGAATSGSASRASEEPVPAGLPQSEEAWKAKLSPESFYVLRKHGTERPFTSPLNGEKRKGTFVCAGCGNRLFSSSAEFDSGTGWPSFFAPLSDDGSAVEEEVDRSFFMMRNEVHCAKCKGHLGHRFPDGPRPTGQRYCMNGVSFEFVPDEA